MIKPPYTKWINDLQAAAAYVEDGDTATKKAYTWGEFIVWKGSLYTVNNGGIALGSAITGHVTAVTGGGLNALGSVIPTYNKSDIVDYPSLIIPTGSANNALICIPYRIRDLTTGQQVSLSINISYVTIITIQATAYPYNFGTQFDITDPTAIANAGKAAIITLL